MIFVCCHGDAIFLHIFVLFSFFPPTLYEYGGGICALFSSATPSFWYFYPSRLMTRRPLDDAMETHGRRRRIEARKMDVWLGWRAGERLGEGLARVRSPAGAALMEGKGGLGCCFFLGREGAGGRSFLRRRKPGFGTEGGESQWHGKQTPRRSSRLVWKSEFRALLLVDSLVSNLRGEKYQVGRVRRRWQLVRGGCPLFFLVCHLAHTHHESNAASFF